MSKRSKQRKAARLAASQSSQSSDIVTGNMIERMSTIARESRQYNDGYSYDGWRKDGSAQIYDPEHDLRKQDREGKRWDWQRDRQVGYTPPSSSPTLFHVQQGDDETFTCAAHDEVAGCPIAKPPEVYIPAMLWDTFVNLANQVDTEWIAYLYGKLDQAGHYRIKSFYFPPQTATGSSVDIPTGYQPLPGVIGAIHSHVKMAAFFSQCDKDHSNWPLEIVVNARGDYKALVRHQLKCGSFSKSETTVYLEGSHVNRTIELALSVAFAKGAKLAKGKVAQPDNSPEPASSGQQASSKEPSDAEVDSTLAQVAQVAAGAGDSLGGSEGCGNGISHMDDSVAGATIEECQECRGIGISDSMLHGIIVEDICGKCHGWGKLVDGKPIAAAGPDGMVC